MSAVTLSLRGACELIRQGILAPQYSQPSIDRRAEIERANFAEVTGRELDPKLALTGAEREWQAYETLVLIAEGHREPRVLARKFVRDFASWLADMADALDDGVRT